MLAIPFRNLASLRGFDRFGDAILQHLTASVGEESVEDVLLSRHDVEALHPHPHHVSEDRHEHHAPFGDDPCPFAITVIILQLHEESTEDLQ